MHTAADASPAASCDVLVIGGGPAGATIPSTYQVRRSEFDHNLFRNAVRKGARAIEGCRAASVEFHAQGARVMTVGLNPGPTLAAWKRRKRAIRESGVETTAG